MKDGPSIVRVASLIGDRARAEMLAALLSDRALTASELAGLAGVTRQTASAHLAKLVAAGLVAVAQQGRHRYFQLAHRDVAQLLESMMGIAFRTGALPLRSSPREPALRKARVCYDHLAGELGVRAYEGLLAQKVLVRADGGVALTPRGRTWLLKFGVEIDPPGRRTLCRPCLDWSERRHHLAGHLGAALLARIEALGWARRVRGTRVVAFTAGGERAFRQRFDAGRPIPPAPT